MATWSPISNTVPQYYDAGVAASGFYLKFYRSGTTTATEMATDSAGGTTLDKCEINSEGYPVNGSGDVFIPHIDRSYKLVLYRNATDADNDTTANAAWEVDELSPVTTSGDGVDYVDSVAALIAGSWGENKLKITSYYDPSLPSVDGPKGGHYVHKTGATNSAPTVGTAVSVSTIGTGTQAGYYWDSEGAEWEVSGSQEFNTHMFGAYTDGSNSDSSSITNACYFVGTRNGGDVWLDGDHSVTVTKGTNDKYGSLCRYSNVKLKGRNGASVRRLSSDISTYALSFPSLLCGVPDDNDTQISDIEITGIEFIGEDTRHSTNGSALMDGRQSIWLKNVKGADIHGNKFTSIDSSAIYVQAPGMYDYENAAYYNTTKCYKINIHDNDFIAESHSTNGRALLHAIVANADTVHIINNNFEWCDDCLSASTTYDDYEDLETDTYTNTNLGLAVKRTGRGYTIEGNTFYNSSEHALYLEAMGMTVGPNTVVVDNPTVCNTIQYQVRGRGVSITGGTMTGVSRAGAINVGSMDVTWKGTVINAVGDSAGGIINIQSQGLTSYIDARSDYFGSYKAMCNIRVDVTVNMVEASQTNGVGIRLYTDTTDANFPNGQMINVNLRGTTINNPMYGVLDIATMGRQKAFDGMIFNGKPINEDYFGTQGTHDGAGNAATLSDSGASWATNELVGYTLNNLTDGSATTITANTATTATGVLSGGTDDDWDASDVYQLIPPITSVAALAVDDAMTVSLRESSLDNNTIVGFQKVLWDWGGAGGAGTIHPPAGIRSNTFKYIKDWDTAAFREPTFENRFLNNSGRFFLDRDGWFSSTAINNSLNDGTSNSEKKGCIQLVGAADVRIYYDDDNNYKAL